MPFSLGGLFKTIGKVAGVVGAVAATGITGGASAPLIGIAAKVGTAAAIGGKVTGLRGPSNTPPAAPPGPTRGVLMASPVSRAVFGGRMRNGVEVSRAQLPALIPGAVTAARALGRVTISQAVKIIAGIGGTIAAGFLLDSSGEPIARVARPRARGISASELRGFRRVTGLLCRVGMVPKGIRSRRACPPKRCA